MYFAMVASTARLHALVSDVTHFRECNQIAFRQFHPASCPG